MSVCLCAYNTGNEGKTARKGDGDTREPVVFVLNAQCSAFRNLGQKTSIPNAGPGD